VTEKVGAAHAIHAAAPTFLLLGIAFMKLAQRFPDTIR
jgi:hypothetical protein